MHLSKGYINIKKLVALELYLTKINKPKPITPIRKQRQAQSN